MKSKYYLVILFFSVLLVQVPAQVVSYSDNTTEEKTINNSEKQKIKIILGETVLTATLDHNQTSQDFISLLLLMVTMNDLFRREKYAHLPSAISEAGQQIRTFEVGYVPYWAPGPDVAIFYRQDGQVINSGLYLLGKIDSGIEAFNVPSSVKVKMELME